MEEKDWNAVAQQAVEDDAAFDELYEHFFPKIYNLTQTSQVLSTRKAL
ncbi:hypothetical protein [Selenomonas ruminantium]|nr:hypothetical protein [Selenomonas ruminantium]